MKFTALQKKEERPLAGYKRFEAPGPAYIEDYLEVKDRQIPVIGTRLGFMDRLGAVKMRWGFGRSGYRVLPGVYAVGHPVPDSPVLVSANYKLSFDALRRELSGIAAWILVIDTKGVNVWCAAGKGSFGTAELASKLARTRLADLLSHRKLVLPQLAATGVSAPELAKGARFQAIWGPVMAKDLPAFLAAGMQKDKEMRLVPFGLRDRMAVAPVEFTQAAPFFGAALALSCLYALPGDAQWFGRFLGILGFSWGAILAACFAFPALLPVLPFRAFALKGALLGTAWGLCASALLGAPLLGAAGLALASAATVAFLAMGFTGASTFTSQRGATLEVERGLPWMLGALALALGLGLGSRLFGI